MKIKVLILLVLVSISIGSAYAVVPGDVSSALNIAFKDCKSVAYIVFGIVVGIFSIKLMRKAL